MKPGTPYFPHDANARRDAKMIRLRNRLGLAGVGLFWSFVELLHEQGGAIAADEVDLYSHEFAMATDQFAEAIHVLVDIGLLELSTDNPAGIVVLTNRRILDDIDRRRRLSQAGGRGAIARWGSQKTPPDDVKTSKNGEAISPANSVANGIRGDKRKGDKIRTRKDAPSPSATTPAATSGILIDVIGSGSPTIDVPVDLIDTLRAAFPDVDIVGECRKAAAWCHTNKSRRKTASGVPKFLYTWMERAVNSGRYLTNNTGGSNGRANTTRDRIPPQRHQEPPPRNVDDIVEADASRRARWGGVDANR